jgi:hypothetical protein
VRPGASTTTPPASWRTTDTGAPSTTRSPSASASRIEIVCAPWWKRRSWAPPAVSSSRARPPAPRMTNRVWSSDSSPASAASVLRTAVRSQVRAPSAVTRACSQLSTVCASHAGAWSAVHGASGGTAAAIASSSRMARPMATAVPGSLAGNPPS